MKFVFQIDNRQLMTEAEKDEELCKDLYGKMQNKSTLDQVGTQTIFHLQILGIEDAKIATNYKIDFVSEIMWANNQVFRLQSAI